MADYPDPNKLIDPNKVGDRMLLASGRNLSAEGEALYNMAFRSRLLADSGRSFDGKPVVFEATMGPNAQGAPTGPVNRDDPGYMLVTFIELYEIATLRSMDELKAYLKSFIEEVMVASKASADARLDQVNAAVDETALRATKRIRDSLEACMERMDVLEAKFEAQAAYMVSWQERWHKTVIDHVKETIRGFVRVSQARVQGDAALIKKVLLEEFRGDLKAVIAEEIAVARGQFAALGTEAARAGIAVRAQHKAENPGWWDHFKAWAGRTFLKPE